MIIIFYQQKDISICDHTDTHSLLIGPIEHPVEHFEIQKNLKNRTFSHFRPSQGGLEIGDQIQKIACGDL